MTDDLERHVGWIDHVWPRAHAAAVKLDSAAVRVGDLVRIVGKNRDLVTRVESIEVGHHRVPIARPGEDVAIGVHGDVKRGDEVFLMQESGPKE